MVLSVDDDVAKFPMKAMPKINREPDYGNINTMMQLFYVHAASLPTALGGGKHGHTGIIVVILPWSGSQSILGIFFIGNLATTSSTERTMLSVFN